MASTTVQNAAIYLVVALLEMRAQVAANVPIVCLIGVENSAGGRKNFMRSPASGQGKRIRTGLGAEVGPPGADLGSIKLGAEVATSPLQASTLPLRRVSDRNFKKRLMRANFIGSYPQKSYSHNRGRRNPPCLSWFLYFRKPVAV